jgi:futalosine hydrolase
MEKIDLAILGATTGEIAPLCSLFEPAGSFKVAGNPFSTYMYGDLRLLVGTTGVGKVNAAATTASALSSFRAAEVWNIGCAGAYSGSGLELGDVLITLNCICGDEGILGKNGPMPTSRLGIPLVLKDGQAFHDFFPLDEFVSRRQIRTLIPAGDYSLNSSGGIQPCDPGGHIEKGLGFRIQYGPSLTVGMVSGDAQTAAERSRRYGVLAENMEGSAVAQTCLLFDVPFLELRGISNMAGVRDKASWELAAALEHCVAVTRKLLDNLVF